MSKGKSKRLPLEKLGDVLGSMHRVMKEENAATQLATEHQLFTDRTDAWEERADEARQSEQRLGSRLDSSLEAEGIKEEVDATVQRRLAADDGPSHEPAAVGGMVELQTMWLDRAVTMAKADGFTVTEFIERLIKRQWIASGGGKR